MIASDSGTTLGTDSSVGTGDSAAVDAALPDSSVTDSGDAGENCPAPLVNEKLVDLNDPASPKKAVVGAGVHLTGAVVTSAKFLAQKSPGGTCTYGVFVADALATFAPYSGILVLARGVDAKTTGTSTFCDIAAEPLPRP